MEEIISFLILTPELKQKYCSNYYVLPINSFSIPDCNIANCNIKWDNYNNGSCSVTLFGNGGLFPNYKNWFIMEIYMKWRWNEGYTYVLIAPRNNSLIDYNKVVAIPLHIHWGSCTQRDNSVIQYYLHNLLEEMFRVIDNSNDYKSMLQYLINR